MMPGLLQKRGFPEMRERAAAMLDYAWGQMLFNPELDGPPGYCREYTTTVVIDGRTERAHGTACRQPDGIWQRGG